MQLLCEFLAPRSALWLNNKQ